MFPHRVESFFSKYVLSSVQPLSEITDYVIKIEFQMHGLPHVHYLLWVKDGPKIDKDPGKVVCPFIDKYITATLPTHTLENAHDIRLMGNFQKHTHSDYCSRNKSCHFGFPKPPTMETLISHPPVEDDDNNEVLINAEEFLQLVQQVMSMTDLDAQDVSIEELLQQINLDGDTYPSMALISY